MTNGSSTPGNAPSAAPYTPPATGASERLLGSVLSRVAGPLAAPIGRTLQFADRLVGGTIEDDAGRRSAPRPDAMSPTARLYPSAIYGAPAAAEAQQGTIGAMGQIGTTTSPAGETTATETGVPMTVLKAPAKGLRAAAAPAQIFAAGPRPASRADLRLPKALKPALLMSAPERMWSAPPLDLASDPEAQAPPLTLVTAGFEPKAAAPAARAATRSNELAAPLWEALPQPNLAPVLAAVESDLNKTMRGEMSPAMPLLQSNDAASKDAAAASRPRAAAQAQSQSERDLVDASAKLLDAVRAHAAAHSAGTDDRISLGDMTMIAFADSRQQLAAASAFNVPNTPDIERAVGHMPHPKVPHTNDTVKRKIEAMAKIVLKDMVKKRMQARDRTGNFGNTRG